MFDALKKLKKAFIEDAEARSENYWTDPEVLASYDQVFAERIRWKWAHALAPLPPMKFERVIDFGCGTGAAIESFIKKFQPRSVHLVDRSSLASQFAAQKINIPVTQGHRLPELENSDTVLLSHVCNELSDSELSHLLEKLKPAKAVFWLEPGTPAHSATLIRIRKKFLNEFGILAPCPHSSGCGFESSASSAWCHFFAEPPPEIFQSAFWKKASTKLKLDLRSLPYSYLFLYKGYSQTKSDTRPLARPKIYKGYWLETWCIPGEVQQKKRLQKDDPALYRALKKTGRFID